MLISQQFNVTPHAARLWLTSVNIPNEQNMQALAKWLKVDPRWLRYGGVLEDSFTADYMSLSEEDKATVRAMVGGGVNELLCQDVSEIVQYLM